MMILGSNPCFVATPPYLTYLHSSNGVSKLTKVSKFRARSTGEIPHQETRRCECYDLHNELIPYYKAWNWQKSIMRKRHDLVKLEKDYSDTVIILQHPSVYTLGTGSSKEYLKFDIDNAPYDIYRTERGGEVTYHGPGQLVMYPIINLNYHEKDIDKYLRKLEDVIIQALSSTFSIRASRLKGFTGVWVGDYKLAAIGIGASRWITYHGLALNITTDLSPFELIVPCGIRNRQVGSIEGILKEGSSTGTGIDTPSSDACQLLEITYKSLLKQFSEVFQLPLDHKPVSDLMLL